MNPQDKSPVNINDSIYRLLIEQAPVATSLYYGPDFRIEIANEMMLGYWGKNRDIIGLPITQALPELEGQPFFEILTRIYKTGEVYQENEAIAHLVVNGTLNTYYFDYTYKPVFDDDGKIFGIMNIAVDVTEQALSKIKQQESESRFRSVTEQSPMAIGFLTGKEMRVEIANAAILKIWGKDESIIGLCLREALPEIEGQGFLELLDEVYTTGKTYKGDDVLVKLEHEGLLTDVYVDFTYSALRDTDGNVNGVLVLATDISQRMQSLREIAASEEKFRSVIYSAQAAVAVFTGPDLIIDTVNEEFLRFIGRDDDIIGLPLIEAMPEIRGQASIELMNEVYTKGIKTHHFGRQVNVLRDGVLTPNFYNVSYTPLYDGNGEIFGVLDVAIDVTETIKAQEALREAESSLRSAVELAELGTWSLDPIKEIFTYSGRVKEWLGLDGVPENLDDAMVTVHDDDRERVRASLFNSLNPESDGVFDAEFRVISNENGTQRILHAVGKTFFNDSGIPYQVTGIVQDITSAKQIQLALENKVKERTRALRRLNRELEEINTKLVNTNQELEQYAYVASHDLQEPLRKISMFSNLLKDRDTDNRHAATVDKIVGASQRMSLLIKDLLEFSRLLNPDTRFIQADLNQIIKSASQDFELLIEEKNATLVIESLPAIEAVPLQMSQLFYNLIGNALKFTSTNVAPHIIISAQQIPQEEASIHIRNIFNCNYYVISVSDNGIGIEEKYKKQIFEVFKRLHSRSEYSGSGIGLALCRRIVSNHNGSIYIQSEPGQGSTFNIILPEKQQD